MGLEVSRSVKIISLLLFMTTMLLLLQKFSFNKTFQITPVSDFQVLALDDGSDGGKSHSSLSLSNNKYILECEIVPAEGWPFCEYSIDLTQYTAVGESYGVDLSSFDRVGFWVRYENKVDTGIRVHLRNYSPQYSMSDDSSSLKVNSIEWFNTEVDYPVWVNLTNFQVSTWWIVSNNLRLRDMSPEFSDVRYLEVATGTHIKKGTYRLVLEKIEFRGKYLSESTLHFGLIVLWFLSGLGYVVGWYIRHRRKIAEYLERQNELEAINRILNIKSQKLEDKVSRDYLTGVLNREGLQKLFYQSQTDRRENSGLCICFMDLDHFKKVNDMFGHIVGDKVLAEFCSVISENTRETETLARWGGEEFILVCPNSSLVNVAALAEKLRRIVETHKWGNDLNVTCSFGVAQMGDESFESFVRRADAALYAAKAQGRNKVISPEYEHD